jgi:radical SAM superfamily enzyme YgiQ (UPF0313 family)
VTEDALLPHDRGKAAPFLPMSRAEMDALGWDQPDVILVTGDAYVDHPSFAMAMLGRVLEAAGFRVAVLAQPPWQDADAWRQPRPAAALLRGLGGNMDSMINHYTANRKPRTDDAYSPGGRSGTAARSRTAVYAQRCREAFPDVPIVIGGVEASLRRLAHYDYWSDTVRPSMLVDGEGGPARLRHGRAPAARDRARARGRQADRDAARDARRVATCSARARPSRRTRSSCPRSRRWPPTRSSSRTPRAHPSRDQSVQRAALCPEARRAHGGAEPSGSAARAGRDGRVYDLPYARRPHPSYQEPVPAHAMIKDSITLMRGCFGGCTFCSITTHQGASSSRARRLGAARGGDASPRTTSSRARSRTRRAHREHVRDALHAAGGGGAVPAPVVRAPDICKLLGTDHGPLVDLMKSVRAQPGVKRALVASGVRMDLAQRSSEYMRELTAHHVGGHPEGGARAHVPHRAEPHEEAVDRRLRRLRPRLQQASAAAGKEQYLVPYFIASHPGSDVNAMIDLALYLKRNGYRPNQVQDFIPAPLDIATCMYYTGLDPITMKPVPWRARSVTARCSARSCSSGSRRTTSRCARR